MGNLVSIIVPCYNGEEFVDRCFASILRQDYSPLEVIAVNDGSTDRSEERIRAWIEKFKNASINLVCISQENRGPGGATNSGLKVVSGDFLMLMTNCWIPPSRQKLLSWRKNWILMLFAQTAGTIERQERAFLYMMVQKKTWNIFLLR